VGKLELRGFRAGLRQNLGLLSFLGRAHGEGGEEEEEQGRERWASGFCGFTTG